MKRPFWILLCVPGCSTSLPPEMPASTKTVKTSVGPRTTMDLTHDRPVNIAEFSVPRNQVWAALAAAQDAVGIPFESGDYRTGTVVFAVHDRARTIASQPASTFIDCGRGATGDRTDTYRVTVKVHHSIAENTMGLTTLRSWLEAHARNPGLSADPIHCSSRGTLEQQIAGIVTLRLK